MTFSSPSPSIDDEAIAPAPKPVNTWNFWRWLILITLSSSAGFALLKVLFFSSTFKPTPLIFPPQVELPGWQQITPISTKLAPAVQSTADTDFHFVNGAIYQYRQGSQVMTVELRYFTPVTADVNAFLGYYRDANVPPITIKEQPGIGFYGLFTTKGRSHLTTCLNGSGGSTFSREQFTQNRYRQDIRPDRIFRWVIGQTSLLDSRCLWVDLSVPNDPQNPTVGLQTLQQTWPNWSQWWQAYFAKQPI